LIYDLEERMGKARIIITIERDVADTGSTVPDAAHAAYYLKKKIEDDTDLKGNPRVIDIKIEQDFPTDGS
jgi:hypothetical protein